MPNVSWPPPAPVRKRNPMPKRRNLESHILMKTGRVLFLTLFVCCTRVFAADIQMSASLDHQRIAMNEQAVLRVTISGNSSNLPEPQLPGLKEFQISNAGTSQNYSWVNGQTTASVTHTYVLTPQQVGQFTIPPV